MGYFDRIYIDDPQLVCSEGHDMVMQELQTKDLGCTGGDSCIENGRLSIEAGLAGPAPSLPFNGKISVYGSCQECLVFVAPRTGNIHDVWVEFEIEIVDDAVRSIRRTSAPTSEQLAATPQLPFMQGCLGPMSYEEAAGVRSALLRSRR